MKRIFPALLVWCAFAHQAFASDPTPPAPPPAGPYVKLPATIKGDPGSFVRVTADTNGKSVSWKVVDPGLNLFPTDLLKDTKTAVVVSSTPGVYRIWAYTAAGDTPSEIAECVVTIGTPAPPTPPTPPAPTDPLTIALQAAYSGERDAASLATLQAAYKSMAISVVNQKLATNGDALKWIISNIPLDAAKLHATRAAIGAELSAAMGGSSAAALDVPKFSAELAKISAALQAVK